MRLRIKENVSYTDTDYNAAKDTLVKSVENELKKYDIYKSPYIIIYVDGHVDPNDGYPIIEIKGSCRACYDAEFRIMVGFWCIGDDEHWNITYNPWRRGIKSTKLSADTLDDAVRLVQNKVIGTAVSNMNDIINKSGIIETEKELRNRLRNRLNNK